MPETYAPARTATLRAGSDTDDNVFSGIAVGIDDILVGPDGKPYWFSEDELRAAANTQAGQKLTKDHPEHDLGTSPPVDETIGDVTKGGFVEGKGVGYEAQTHDENVATGVEAGTYEVSIHPGFEQGEWVEDKGAYKAENIQFTDLSVVSKGMSPSNTANWGPSGELMAWSQGTDVGAMLGESGAGGSPADNPESFGQRMASGFANALGLTAGATGQNGDDPGGSGTGRGADNDPAMDRDSYIKTLHEEHDFEESVFENMSDENLEQMHDKFADDGSATDGGGAGSGSTSPGTPGAGAGSDPADVGEAVEAAFSNALGDHDSFQELVASQVEATQQAQSKAEKVEEIIAHDDDYDEDDREELMASSMTVIENTHKKATTSSAPRVPSLGGKRSEVEASAGGGSSTDNLDEFGTGVQ